MDGLDRDLGALHARVDALADAFHDFRQESRRGQEEIKALLHTRLADHARRLNALERWRAWIAGGLAVLAALWAGGARLFSVVTSALLGGGR